MAAERLRRASRVANIARAHERDATSRPICPSPHMFRHPLVRGFLCVSRGTVRAVSGPVCTRYAVVVVVVAAKSLFGVKNPSKLVSCSNPILRIMFRLVQGVCTTPCVDSPCDNRFGPFFPFSNPLKTTHVVVVVLILLVCRCKKMVLLFFFNSQTYSRSVHGPNDVACAPPHAYTRTRDVVYLNVVVKTQSRHLVIVVVVLVIVYYNVYSCVTEARG